MSGIEIIEVPNGRVPEETPYKKDFWTALPQIIAVSVKNLLLLSYGMTLGFPTILIPALTTDSQGEEFRLMPSEVSWIGSINLIVVPIGCALSGVVTTPLGRRRAMQLVNVPFFIAWLVFHFSTSSSHLYAALMLTGLAGGLLEAPVLTYVAEITQPHLRGALTATSSMCIIVGVFTQFLFGLLMNWRTTALANIAFTIIAVIALCFVPESPHWLVSRRRYEDARKSLQWLRGWTTSDVVEPELKVIISLYNKTDERTDVQVKETTSEKISHYMKKTFLVPFGLVTYAFFVGHFSGMTTLQTYAVSIFGMLEAPIDKYSATLILGVLQIVGSGACVLLVPSLGKRLLTFVSTAGAGICCVLVAAYDGYIRLNGLPELEEIKFNTTSASDQEDIVDNPYAWMPTTFLMMLAFISHLAIRLLPWILIGEVFTANTRSGAAGLASAMGYILSFLTNKMYLSMVDTLSIWGTYGSYGIICLTGCVVFYFILPETEGKTLQDIENHFSGKRRLSNRIHHSLKRIPMDFTSLKVLIGTPNTSFQQDEVLSSTFSVDSPTFQQDEVLNSTFSVDNPTFKHDEVLSSTFSVDSPTFQQDEVLSSTFSVDNPTFKHDEVLSSTFSVDNPTFQHDEVLSSTFPVDNPSFQPDEV